MKNIFLMVVSIFLLSVSVVYAMHPSEDVCYQKMGSSSLVCQAGTVPSINYRGNVNLYHTNVSGSTRVSGDLSASGADLNAVTVRGNATISRTAINGAMRINGNLKADSNSQMQDKMVVAGNVKADRSNFKKVAIFGDLAANGSSFGAFSVSGDVNVANAKFFQSGTIKGNLIATNSLFSAPVVVKGNVLAVETCFQKDLTAAARKIILKHTAVKNIRDTFSGNKRIDIFLEAGTTVNGPIVFEHGDVKNNIVHQLFGSSIAGEVINGVVVRE